MDGTGLRFETIEHGGEYPDTMPQAIKLVDRVNRAALTTRQSLPVYPDQQTLFVFAGLSQRCRVEV